jgi:CRISPR-associated protein Csm3
MLLDKFHNKYIVKGVLVAQTPIHIGAGEEGFDPIQADNAVIRDSSGDPYIPGTSLKGVLRSYMETLLKSSGKDILDKNCNPCFVVNNPCLSGKEDIKMIKEMKEKYKKNDKIENADLLIAEGIYDRLCPVCKIFGSGHFASKLTVNDCRLKGAKAYIEKRDGIGIDRDTGTAAYGAKYDYEQVAAGTQFEFYMTVDNLEPEYEDLLRLIVKVLENGDLRVGGKTSVGLA